MAYTIMTIEKHEREMAESKERNIRRLDYNVEEVALSSWADANMRSFHEEAIKALRLGAEHGIDGPAGYFPRLLEGERVVDARIIQGQYGRSWLLSAAEAARFGRKFVPMGENSRVQKKLGISEAMVVAPASRTMDSHCASIGCPVTFRLVEKKAA